MTKFTMADLRSVYPCYDPTKFLPEDWTGTLDDLLVIEDCPAEDRIWIVCQLLARENRPKLINFANFCAANANYATASNAAATADPELEPDGLRSTAYALPV